MSPLTIFLAKLLGLYCIVAALAMMIRKQSTVATIQALLRDPPLLLFVEVFGLAAGLATIAEERLDCRHGALLPPHHRQGHDDAV